MAPASSCTSPTRSKTYRPLLLRRATFPRARFRDVNARYEKSFTAFATTKNPVFCKISKKYRVFPLCYAAFGRVSTFVKVLLNKLTKQKCFSKNPELFFKKSRIVFFKIQKCFSKNPELFFKKSRIVFQKIQNCFSKNPGLFSSKPRIVLQKI
jgi:hypothetical protein